MITHIIDLVIWSSECSTYLAEKLPELDEVGVHFVYGDAEKKTSSGCRCVLSFRAFPTLFVRDIVVPEMTRLLEKHAGGRGRVEDLRITEGQHIYCFVWTDVGQSVFNYARAYFKPGKQTVNRWERRSKLRRVPAGVAPLFTGRGFS
jgi:hypothetical protein